MLDLSTLAEIHPRALEGVRFAMGYEGTDSSHDDEIAALSKYAFMQYWMEYEGTDSVADDLFNLLETVWGLDDHEGPDREPHLIGEWSELVLRP